MNGNGGQGKERKRAREGSRGHGCSHSLQATSINIETLQSHAQVLSKQNEQRINSNYKPVSFNSAPSYTFYSPSTVQLIKARVCLKDQGNKRKAVDRLAKAGKKGTSGSAN